MCSELIKLNSESVENLTAEFNNLKLNNVEISKAEKIFCHICKLRLSSYNLSECYFNTKSKKG